MGCCSHTRSIPILLPKFELPSQEKVILEGEKRIPFSSKESKDLDQTFKANGSGGKLSVAQLKKALGLLNIPVEIFTDPDTQVFKFLTRIQNEKKLYDISNLSLCGILLGSGDIPTKARILFNHFDVDASEKLDKSEIEKMLEDMIDISIVKIPILSLKLEDESDDPNQPSYPKLTQQEIDEYVSVLEKGKSKFIQNVILKLLEGADGISIDEFIRKVSNDKYLERIVWSANIRITLYEESRGF